jgi:hypothetical protein
MLRVGQELYGIMVNMFASTESSSADAIRQRPNGAECSRMPVDLILHHGTHRGKRCYWTLDEKCNPVNVRDVVERVRRFDEDKRRVASTEIGDDHVSTHCRPRDRRPL